jgi:hypothetical protein
MSRSRLLRDNYQRRAPIAISAIDGCAERLPLKEIVKHTLEVAKNGDVESVP